MLERRRAAVSGGLTGAVTAASVAVAAAIALAVGLRLSGAVFGAARSSQLPLAVATVRDALLALFVTVPICAVVVALARSEGTRAPDVEPGERRTTRASFLKATAGGIVTVAGGAAALRVASATSPATASSGTVKVSLLLNEGYVKMTDGSPAWMRGFALSSTAGSPLVPGPALGPPAASVPIGEVPFVLEGQPVEIAIKNGLAESHRFVIPGVVGPVPIPAGGNVTLTVNTPASPMAAGTYIYMDADPVQRMLGLHGVMVVMPADGSRRPYAGRNDLLAAPEFDQQYVWILHDIDPVWGEQARTKQTVDFATLLPRYFTINGVSGEQSVASRRNLPARSVNPEGSQGKGTLIRIVNTGAAFHSPHFHGNHVYVLTQNGQLPLVGGVPALSAQGRPLAVEKDVFGIESLGTREVLLPFHMPFDQWPPYEAASSPNYRYPMHCHGEMSQTAGGGQYPSGMYAEWELSGPLGAPKRIGG
jgi:hypothetical protein